MYNMLRKLIEAFLYKGVFMDTRQRNSESSVTVSFKMQYGKLKVIQ